MPRANRYFLTGHAWHLTHRCHGRDFLLKFVRDRRCWTMWLFEARKRYGVTVLNYVVTCNHVHLLVYADGERMAIPQAMQLLAGRTAQEFNTRKGRSGAFWEDRYHATAVESGKHLRRCMTYIDLNMVRAGAVKHPQEWECCGYREIQDPPERYRRIDQEAVVRLLELGTIKELRAWQQQSVRECLDREDGCQRRPEWTESIAVGDESYLAGVHAELGMTARHRSIESIADGVFKLREASAAYGGRNDHENEAVSLSNALAWKLSY